MPDFLEHRRGAERHLHHAARGDEVMSLPSRFTSATPSGMTYSSVGTRPLTLV
jgi:hypothetical protein